jgi:hypothetical protein
VVYSVTLGIDVHSRQLHPSPFFHGIQGREESMGLHLNTSLRSQRLLLLTFYWSNQIQEGAKCNVINPKGTFPCFGLNLISFSEILGF